EALVVAEHGAHLSRPAVEDDEVARGRTVEEVALLVDEGRLQAEERPRGRAGLELGGAGQRRDEDAARLRLPPGVDDRAPALADDAVVPLPRFGVDRLADGAEQLQRRAVGALDV